MSRRFPVPWCEHGAPKNIGGCPHCTAEERTRVARQLLEEIEGILPEVALAFRDEHDWLGGG